MISGCVSPEPVDNATFVYEGDHISEEFCTDYVNDTVLVFVSNNCPACKKRLPMLMEIDFENENITFEYLFIDTKAGMERVGDLGIFPFYVPSVVVGCEVFGLLEKEEYERIILDNFEI